MTSTEAMIYQLKKMKGKPLKQKVEYIVTYYWLPIVIALAMIIAVGSYIVHLSTMNDVALHMICLNAFAESEETEKFETEFAENVGIDLNQYDVHISTDLILNDADLSNAYSTIQVLGSQTAAHSVDLLVGDLNTTTRFFYQEMYWDLNQVLTEQQKTKYTENFLYADMAVVRCFQEKLEDFPQFPDPTKPEEMEEPIPVALLVPEDSEFTTTFYPYHKTGLVIGVVSTSENLETALDFLDYIMQ